MQFKYECPTCAKQLTHSKESSEKADNSLGTWRCPTHGKVPAKRTKGSSNA